MPRYDYRCDRSHVAESVQAHDTDVITCGSCTAPARRIILSAPLVNGFTPRPTKEAPIHVSRFQEAHGEMLRDHEKAGIPPPDFYAEAKRRVARGDVAAIE